MQEHGLLERVLLVYDESARRIEKNEPADLSAIAGAAGIIRRFVEEYHEKLEEKFVFPRLQAARRELELVTVLLRQHERGRQVTEEIVRKANAGAGPELAPLLRDFARMYRPHAAREDTVLFPAFRAIVGRDAYRELGEQFEDEEHRRFGEHGFETTVAEVAKLEAALGIAELAQFTP
jgi:hemerythrin-like domain-containing protein